MIYVARLDRRVIAIDLGWLGAGGALRRALLRVGARPEEVTDVFLTHSHRDHVQAWPLVRRATFHLAADEAALFEGRRRHADLPSRAADAALGRSGPWPGEVHLQTFSRDTAFAFGSDTVWAFLLPGHTGGSAAYLFRGTLFVGDAYAWSRATGLRRPARAFSADRERSRRTLDEVLGRARALRLERICNAHAKCFRADSAFTARLRR